MADKPKVIVLGGCGFIGRHVVTYLAKNDLVSKIRVADKVLPDLAGLSKEELEIYKSPLVDFRQANLAREAMVKKVFDESEGKFDFVINLAAETKYSQTPEVYKENIIDVAVQTATAAKNMGVKRFIEVSTGQVYDAGKKPSDESGKIKPWTKMAKAKLTVEEELKKMGLPLVIVRPAVVYGPGDLSGLTPRIICATIYQKSGEPMTFLWDKDQKFNTVHVDDVAKALWHLTTNGENGEVYNLVDSKETDQGTVAKILESVFGIKTSFMGNMKTKVFTSVSMSTVTETANEKHLKPWSDLCKEKGITNTPLTPYLDEELLYNNPLSLDGTKITKTGFSYDHAGPDDESIRKTVQYFTELNFFPSGLVK